MMAEAKLDNDWLQFFDNTTPDEGDTKSEEKQEKQFNTTNIQGIKYNPYKLTMTNEKSDDIKLLSLKDIEEIIRDYRVKYSAKICNTCGQHFDTYTARDIHNSNRLLHTAKSCKIQFSINKYDKTQVDKAFHDQLTIYIHFTEKRLDEIPGLKSLIRSKLKDEIELLPSNLFSSKDEKYLCFGVPIFTLEQVNKCLYFAMITSYDLEIWYEALFAKNRDYTPQSKYMTLEDDELDALQKLYLCEKFRSSVKPETNSICQRLTRKLDKEIKEFTEQLSGDKEFNREIFSIGEYFCKLSTRSPKDGTGINPKTCPNTTRLERILLMMEKMKIKQGTQVIQLMEKSERVYGDIGFYLHYGIAFAHPLNLIIRSFFKRLNPIFEFRCFIYQKSLNCISQYLCYDVFEELQDVKLIGDIRNEIVKFHDDTKDILPYNDYVMDVFVDKGDDGKLSVFIVEINPFGAGSSSGSALFEWKKDYDLMYGNVDYKEKLPIFRVARQQKGK